MSLKDLPSPSASNFLPRVREMLHTLAGKTGNARDRALTLADAIESGVIGVGPGGSLVPGPEAGETYVPDLTPPPAPDTLTATPAISHILLEVPAATYTQGHGHLRTRVYGVTRLSGDPAPVFADAVEVGQFSGTVWAFPSNPSTTWHLWAKWESVDGVLSAAPVGGTNGVVATTGRDVTLLLDALAGQIGSSQLANDLATPIGKIPALESGLAQEIIDRAQAVADEASARAAALAQEASDRAAAIQAAADAAASNLSTEIGNRVAAIQQVDTDLRAALATADAAVASSLTSAFQSADAATLASAQSYTFSKTEINSAISAMGTQLTTNFTAADAATLASAQNFTYSRSAIDAADAATLSTLRSEFAAADSTTLATAQNYTYSRATIDSAIASSASTLRSQLTGGSTATDLNALTSGLLYQMRETSAAQDAALAQDITNLQADLSTLSGDVATKASSSALSALETRVTSAEGVNTSQGSAITSLQNSLTATNNTVATKADASALSALTTRVTSAEGTITSHGARLNTLESTVNNPTTGVAATAAALDAVETLVNNGATGVTATANKTALLESKLSNARDIFAETWDGPDPLSRWQSYDGAGEQSIVSVADGVGGKALRVGNNAGNDQAWLLHRDLIPFDPNKLYRMRVKVRRTNGSGVVYVGWAGVASDGTTLVSSGGENFHYGAHYHAAASASPGAVWTEYVGYTKGHGAPYGDGGVGSLVYPGKMHQNVRYLRALVLVNYNGAAGITEVGPLVVDDAEVKEVEAGLSTAIATKASQTALNDLSTRVEQTEDDIIVQGQDISALQGSLETVENGLLTKADASALNTLSTTVSNQGDTLVAQGTAVTSLQARVNRVVNYRIMSRGSSSGGMRGVWREDGSLVVEGGRSYTLTVLNGATGAVESTQSYDVFGAGEVDGRTAATLAADLNALGSDKVVVIHTWDEPRGRRLDSGLDAAMYRCGASRGIFGAPDSAFRVRSAYILVGIPGIGEGAGVERYAGAVDYDPMAFCEYNLQLINGRPVGLGGNMLQAALTRAQTAQVDGDAALAQDIAQLVADVGNKASITQLNRVESDAAQALATAQMTLQSSIDGISVGGRNLLPGSDGGAGWTDWYAGNEFRITRSSTSESGFIYSPHINLTPGAEIVISFESKQTGVVGSCDFFILSDNWWLPGGGIVSGSYPLSTDWVRNVFKFTVPAGLTEPMRVRFDHNGGDGSPSTVHVRKVKLEYGNIATDWTPAPEDITAALQVEATARASQTGDLFAKYTVKVDVAGHVGGYGFASKGNAADPVTLTPGLYDVDSSRILSVQRNTTATYIDGSGVLQTAPANTARYQGGQLLVEGEGTNFFVPSNDPALLLKVGISAAFVTEVNPFGQAGAHKLTEDTGFSRHGFYGGTSFDLSLGKTYTAGVLVKPAGRSLFRLISFSGGDDTWTMFDVGSGVVVDNRSTTPFVRPLSNGWFWCGHEFTVTVGGASLYRCQLFMHSSAGEGIYDGYAGDGVSGLLFGGAHVLDSNTSYIPTTTAPATRAADIVTVKNDAVTSEFGIRADQFFVAPPATSSATAPTTNLYKGMVWVDTSVTPNVTRYYTGSSWSTTPQALPFVVQTTPQVINGETVQPGIYGENAFFARLVATRGQIGLLAVDDARIANLSVSKLTAGSLDVGQYAQSTGYVAGSNGWRINGDGTAEFSGVVVRGTVFASAGLVGGITIEGNALRSGQVGLNAGDGFFLGGDGTMSIGSSSGERIVWDGSSLEIETADFGLSDGNARFSGDISGATGSFSGTLLAGTIDVTQLVGQTLTYSTPGTYTATVPASFTRMRATVVGAGGAGGNGAQNGSGSNYGAGGGGGGGSGGLSIATFTVTPGSTISITVGAGGSWAGAAGGQSVVSGYISANGGAGGANATKSGPISFNGGAGGGAGSGSTKSGYPGGSGGNGNDYLYLPGGKNGGDVIVQTVRGAPGSGGSSSFGGRGQGGTGGGYNLGPAAGGSGFVQIEFFNPNGVIIRSDWDVLQSALLRQGIQVA